MSISLDHIKAPIAGELELFEQKFRDSMKSNTPLLDAITRYIVKSKGKQVRPMFVFLSAKMFGDITERTYRAAALIELLHTATLVHDDVVDDSYERRGFFSINALWKNKIAVLVGDYLLSKGLLLSISNKDFNMLELVSDAVREMSEGELLQIEKTRKLNISEEVYFEIIRQKTATLISSACACGAASSGVSAEEVSKMKLFGEKIGIAFQIKDDLLDYSTEDTGKPKGIDIKEKKMTLPVIYLLNHASGSDRRKVINTIKNHHDNKEKVREIIEMVLHSGGIEYATKKMNGYKEEALQLLTSFPDSASRRSLEDLVAFTTARKK
ncbi:MAG TPA: polyprenyl synthetase family protein [Chitinophagales bacterium]|nr:polyprenyl synthetase family protein [Chitinophagales bacterium]